MIQFPTEKVKSLQEIIITKTLINLKYGEIDDLYILPKNLIKEIKDKKAIKEFITEKNLNEKGNILVRYLNEVKYADYFEFQNVLFVIKYYPEYINLQNSYLQTLLTTACKVSSYGDLVNKLINKGADVNLADENGDTPLIIAAQYSNNNFVEMLLDAGANPNIQNKKGETVLMFAVNRSSNEGSYKTIEKLLESGSDISTKCKLGYDAWFWFQSGKSDVSELMERYSIKV